MRWFTSPRLDEPISIATPGRFERPVYIPVSDRYFLYIYFSRKDATFATLRAIVGGAYGQKIEVDGKLIDAGEPPGLAIPLRWSLQHAASGAVAAFGESLNLGCNSWSADEVGRLLHKWDIDAGRYIFKGELLRGVPEFQGIRARVVLALSPKHGHSWAIGVYNWPLLFLPLALLGAVICALTAAILAWR
jgi:hypothetical protein